MNVRVKFLGAAQSVTGSKFLFEIGHIRLLVDCGLFQGIKSFRLRNWEPLPINPAEIDMVVLTHAHIDHSGYLPRLVKDGFSGPIYCTEATAALLEIMLLDAAKLQEEEANFAKKKGYSKHEDPQPLFTTEHAEAVLHLLHTSAYNTATTLAAGISAIFRDAGHILGSAIVELIINGEAQQKTIVLSGDIGRYSQPILADPTAIDKADILLVESTYGDRDNAGVNVREELAAVINEGLEQGGVILIPSFAVGRTQSVLYYLTDLQKRGAIPTVPIYVDSPMAISTTRLYHSNPTYHNITDAESFLESDTVHYYQSQEASASLNNIKSNAIILSASGMCTGGRILHHLYHRLQRKVDTLLFVGYQAYGTRGRRILDGEPTSRIFGIEVSVKCSVKYLHGLSAHADRHELHQWLGHFTDAPKMSFIVHGEPDASLALAHHLRLEKGWDNVYVPNYMESFELFRGI